MNVPSPYNTLGAPIHPVLPRRRQPAHQPPSLLTSSLENARQAGLGAGAIQTPQSTGTSLSTPFSAYPQSAHPLSVGGSLSGGSPMSVRHAPSFSSQYNPQQWGPMSNASPQAAVQSPHQQRIVALAPRLVGPDGRLSRDSLWISLT